jgi:site-specific recombinase XerD
MKTLEAIQLFIANCELRDLSARTLEQYSQQLSYLSKFFEELPTKAEDIETVLVSLINVTQETKHFYFSTYRTFYNFLDKRHKTGNPMLNVTPPRLKNKIMPTLEMSDIGLLSVFLKDDTPKHKRDKSLLTLFIDTGIRTSEATGLKREDIKENYIKIIGKVGERIVPISDSVAKLLLELPEHEDGYVFHGQRGRLTRNGVYEIVRKYLTKIGITGAKLGGHRFRHTFGRQYLVLGGDLRSLQMIMGHSNISTTTKYANLAIEDVIEKHRKYTPWDNYLSEVNGSEKVTMDRLAQQRRR